MKKHSKIIGFILSGIGGFSTFITTMFMTEIKAWIILHYPLLIFGVSIFVMLLGIVIFIVRWAFKEVFEEKYDGILKSQNDKYDTLLNTKENIEKDFNEMKVLFLNITSISHAVILKIINNPPDIQQNAQILFNYFNTSGLTIPQWKNYGLHKDLVLELEKLYHEKELEKIAETQNKNK